MKSWKVNGHQRPPGPPPEAHSPGERQGARVSAGVRHSVCGSGVPAWLSWALRLCVSLKTGLSCWLG